MPTYARDVLEMTAVWLLLVTRYQRWGRGHKARGQGQAHKKIRGQGQGQPFRGQTLSRPRTGMLEAKTDIAASVLQKNKVFKKVF